VLPYSFGASRKASLVFSASGSVEAERWVRRRVTISGRGLGLEPEWVR
jgi:hypothetical protein